MHITSILIISQLVQLYYEIRAVHEIWTDLKVSFLLKIWGDANFSDPNRALVEN